LPAEAIAERLAAVRRAIAEAAARVGRDSAGIRIVAVTKAFPAEAVAAALDAGLTDIGESYVQEARTKRAAVPAPATWHMIGGLQRNKVRAAVAVFDWVHTVDSVPLAGALAAEAAWGGRRLPVLVQVNPAGEPTKRGVPVEGVEALLQAVLAHPSLRLEGLMAIPPPGGSRPHFRAVREARDHAATRLGVELPHLSMGMSNDFVVAVEEGATLLRLGRALFGARGPGARRPGS
jgi:pyridoxal phosphate enzyme (YggS family)